MDERRPAVLHKFLAQIREGSLSLEGIVFLLSSICGLSSLSLPSLFCVILAFMFVRNLLNASRSTQDLSHSERISKIVSHLEADQDDLRHFLVQSKAAHLTLKLSQSGSRADSTCWLNSLIAKLWPMSEIEAAEILDQLGLSRKGQGFRVGGFRVFVDRFTLGKRPPVISRLSVGDKKQTKKEEVSVDLHLAYFGNCLVSFTHPISSVADFKVGLKDIRFQGEARLVLRPLLDDLPLVGGIVFCFLNAPAIDFEGVSFLNLIDNRLIKNALDTAIRGLMVRPNKIYITLENKDWVKRKIILPDLMGIGFLHLIRARSLKTPRVTLSNKQTVDPVVLLRVAETFFQTDLKKDNPNPIWLFTRSAPFNDLLETVSLQVFDRHTRDRADVIGEVSLSIQSFYQSDEVNGKKIWTAVDKESLSSLQLRLACMEASRELSTLTETLAQKASLPKDFPMAVVSIYIHSIRTYPGIEAGGRVAPFIQLRYGRQSHSTTPFNKNYNSFPRKVNDGCHFMLTDDPRKELLHVLAINGNKVSPSAVSSSEHVYSEAQILGSRSLDLSGIVEAVNMMKEVKFNLYHRNLPVVKISMFLSIAAAALSPTLIQNLSSEEEISWPGSAGTGAQSASYSVE